MNDDERPNGPPRRRAAHPLDTATLDALALRYVARYATTRARLLTYLNRKLRERGWQDSEPAPDPVALADRMVAAGYVDDRAFAAARARSLTARGLGPRRVTLAMAAAGVGEDDRPALDEDAALNAARRFAQRRRFDRTGDAPGPAERQRRIAAFLRAGHSYAVARAIIDASGDDDGDDGGYGIDGD